MPDPLTGLPSSRDLVPTIADGDPPALVVDIDSFIWMNDQFGHEVADRALVAIARELTRLFQALTPTSVFRVAGDAFLVVLPASGVDATDAASRVVEGIRALSIPYRRPDRPERSRLEVNVVVVRLTPQRLSQSFGESGLAAIYDEYWGELVDREKLRRSGQPGVVVDTR